MAVEVGLYVEGEEGVTWRDWQRLATRAEALGFDAVVSSVHLRSLQAPGRWNLDVWPVMTAIALWTRRIRFGPMVLPLTFSHPVQIARRAASLDRLSNGRFRLRLGAGRDAGEHQAFGLSFPEHDLRVAMLGEAVRVIRRLWSGEPVSFQGAWYQLQDAQIQPTPEHRWVGVGGDSESSLRVAAAEADEWCTAGATAEKLRHCRERLDTLAREAGRDPRAVARSVMSGVLVGQDRVALRRRAVRLAELIPAFAGEPPEALLDRAGEEWRWWVGTPRQVVEQVRPLIRAGADQVFFQLFDFRDLRALNLLAREVIPLLRS